MDINISEYLDDNSILLDVKAAKKKDILAAILDRLADNKKIKKEDKKDILKVILQREEMGSTAIGGGIALPHARIVRIKDIQLSITIFAQGVDFDSLDQEPVNVVALLLSNQKEAGMHLKMLAALARMLRDKYFVQHLRAAGTVQDVIALITKQQHVA
jgi:nitrogen PTS system EIIA component